MPTYPRTESIRPRESYRTLLARLGEGDAHLLTESRVATLAICRS
jgi:hypothetical protein